MRVYWFEQTSADVPERDDWLSLYEQAVLAHLRIPKRRHDWRLGRWTAKRAVAACRSMPDVPHVLAAIEIHSAPSGMPEIFVAGTKAGQSISISHRADVAACAVSSSSGALGCDVELVEPRNENFVADFFAAEEQAMVKAAADEERGWLLTLLWSAKESALKALGQGLRLDTRTVTARPAIPIRYTTANDEDSAIYHSLIHSGRWSPLQVRNSADRVFHGWWRLEGNLVRTLVSDPPSGLPRPLSFKADNPPKVSSSFEPPQADNFSADKSEG